MARSRHAPVASRVQPRRLAERVELWALERLVPYAANARTHPDDQVRRIAESIRRYGFNAPLLVRASGEIVAGHGRLEAARLLGLAEVPVVPLDHLTEREAQAYRLADNRLAELGGWDEEALARELAALEAEPMELGAIGWTEREVAEITNSSNLTAKPEDDLPDEPPPERPTSRRGDLWALGEHRLLVGDSRRAEDRERLLAGEPAALVLTDPPYAIYGSTTGVGSDVADDRMVRDFFETVLRAAAAALPVGRHAYVFCDWRSWASWWEAVRGSGLAVANMLVWVKGQGLGTNYQNTHELVCFLHRASVARSVWGKTPKGARPVMRPNVLRYGRAGTGEFEREEPTTTRTVTAHNAAKPVDLLRELVVASTDPGERVLDLFAGSGSTLLACQLAGRRGLALEIEPRWADVALRRWERLAGAEARIEGGGTLAEVAALRAAEPSRPGRRRRRSAV